MSTQVSFTADRELKKRTREKAKKDGITLKTILLYSMKAYVEGKIQFGIITEEEHDVEEIILNNKSIEKKAQKLVNLLK